MIDHSPQSRALEVNLDSKIYGTFAEIGAGQEVARHFFQAGKASQTIAKTMSAYDMNFSDEIYGKESNGRYVCESRLKKMLDKEYSLLIKRLSEKRGDSTTFFAYANTVATSTDTGRCHGWMGLRFQTEPLAPFSEIIIHVRMLDRYRLQQQEVIGNLGVNLVYTCFRGRNDMSTLLDMLTSGIKPGRLAIDIIRFSGPGFSHLNEQETNLELVNRNLADALLFDDHGEITFLGDFLFKKPTIVLRGTFKSFSKDHIELIDSVGQKMTSDFSLPKESLIKMFEMSFHPNQSSEAVSPKQLLSRAKAISDAKQYALISKFPMFFQLKQFLRQYSESPLGFVIRKGLVEKIFDENFYSNLDGGLTQGLGLLLSKSSILYIDDRECSQKINPEAVPLFEYYKSKSWIRPTN